MCPYASHTCKHRHLHIAVAFRASVASLPLLTMWPDDWVIVGLFCSRNLLCILRQLYRLWARSHTGLHIPGLKLIFGHPEWREMRGALYWMSANSNSPDNAASFVGVKRPFHQVGRMEGREEKRKEVGLGLYSSRFWHPANHHEDNVYVKFIDKSKISLVYAHLNESLL